MRTHTPAHRLAPTHGLTLELSRAWIALGHRLEARRLNRQCCPVPQVVYERAIACFPITTELWAQYTRYLETNLKVGLLASCLITGTLWRMEPMGKEAPPLVQVRQVFWTWPVIVKPGHAGQGLTCTEPGCYPLRATPLA